MLSRSYSFGSSVLKLGVVIKKGSNQALKLGIEVLKFASEKLGIDTYVDSEVVNEVKWKSFRLGIDEVDYILVIGGDGTVLRTLHRLGNKVVPLITVKHGKRGFLCDVPPFEYRLALRKLMRGDFKLVKYMRLKAKVNNKRELPYVLNDYVITTTGKWRSKVARLNVFKGDDPIYTIVGDGLIICPPAGSTAYNLAAGGPVVDPELEVIIVTPLAPITFCSRSVILPKNSLVKVKVLGDSPPLVLICDGIYEVNLKPGDEVVVTNAEIPAVFVRFNLGEFYARLFERCM